MNKEDLRIVFMGTPDFAVKSLSTLIEYNYNVVGVVTMPDKPSGRGHKLQYSAVKEYALSKNLPLLQPEKLKDETFLDALKAWNADLQIVVAFRMLPEIVWDMPRLGTFNLHASLLPQYRGAAPINWAIINGDKETGVSTFFLTHEIDTGKIILQNRIPIEEDDDFGIVYEKLMNLGAKLVIETVDLIIEDKVDAIDQGKFEEKDIELKAAPKIFKETCRIDWNLNAETVHNFVRGLSPYPTAWSVIYSPDDKEINIKIFKTEPTTTKADLPVGHIVIDNKNNLYVVCKDYLLLIKELQLPGKKAMKAQDLLRGYKIEEKSYLK